MKDAEFLSWLHEKLIDDGYNRRLGFMDKLQDIAVKALKSLYPLWTEEQVAERYGIELKTLRTWRSNKSGGPAYIKVSRSVVRYRQEDLMTWELIQMRHIFRSNEEPPKWVTKLFTEEKNVNE